MVGRDLGDSQDRGQVGAGCQGEATSCMGRALRMRTGTACVRWLARRLLSWASRRRLGEGHDRARGSTQEQSEARGGKGSAPFH